MVKVTEKSSQGRILTIGDKGEMFAIYVRRMLGKVSGGRGGPKQKQREWVYQEEDEAPPKRQREWEQSDSKKGIKDPGWWPDENIYMDFPGPVQQILQTKWLDFSLFQRLEVQGLPSSGASFPGVDGCHPVSSCDLPHVLIFSEDTSCISLGPTYVGYNVHLYSFQNVFIL